MITDEKVEHESTNLAVLATKDSNESLTDSLTPKEIVFNNFSTGSTTATVSISKSSITITKLRRRTPSIEFENEASLNGNFLSDGSTNEIIKLNI